jgi:hypothetical protein
MSVIGDPAEFKGEGLKCNCVAFGEQNKKIIIHNNFNNFLQQLFRWGTNNRSNECEIRTQPSGKGNFISF